MRQLFVIVTCDDERCDQQFMTPAPKTPGEMPIEHRIKNRGWISTADGDYCPTHKQKDLIKVEERKS